MNHRRLATSMAILMVALGTPAPALGQPSEPIESVPEASSSAGKQPNYGDGIQGQADVADGSVTVSVGAKIDGTPGLEGTVEQAGGDPEPAPEGFWIDWWMIDFGQDPPCLRVTGETLDVESQAEADLIAAHREQLTVAQWEAHVAAGNDPPQTCDTSEGFPGFGPTPGEQFTDSAEEILPTANPTISGGYAITGLRSWLDLERPSSLTTDHHLLLGRTPVPATITATATATVDWGDGTITTHTARGGGYHDGEPGPDDITHTYRDAVDPNTLTVTDSWDVTITFPDHPVPDITLSWTADPITLTFPIREVRSSRDR